MNNEQKDIKPSDIKHGIREAEDEAKAALRKADGESVQDELANAADKARTNVETAGDKVHEGVDELGREAEYQRGRVEQAVQDRKPDQSENR